MRTRQAEHDAIILRDTMRYYDIREREGWTGAFTTRQSPMAKINNGARVRKVQLEDGDAHEIGATGTVLGSVGAPAVGVAYYVAFDSSPREATLIVEGKVAEAAE